MNPALPWKVWVTSTGYKPWQNWDMFPWRPLCGKHHRNNCFCTLTLEFGVGSHITTYENSASLCLNYNIFWRQYQGTPIFICKKTITDLIYIILYCLKIQPGSTAPANTVNLVANSGSMISGGKVISLLVLIKGIMCVWVHNNKNRVLGPLLLSWLTLIPAWISNHMPNKVWDEITYPFPNFNGCTTRV